MTDDFLGHWIFDAKNQDSYKQNRIVDHRKSDGTRMQTQSLEIFFLVVFTAFPRKEVQVQDNKALDLNDKNLIQKGFLSGDKAQLQC